MIYCWSHKHLYLINFHILCTLLMFNCSYKPSLKRVTNL